MDTIFAVSSGRPPAAIAVIRISGSASLAIAEVVVGNLPSPRRAGLRKLRSAAGELLDEALVLFFPGPASATGENLVELHCHGGRAVIAAVESRLSALGARPAQPGEFTRRALVNGRIDLAEAEGLADLLSAETEAQRVMALGNAQGRVSRAVHVWMERLSSIAAEVEAALDFSDEGDVSDDPALASSLAVSMNRLATEIDDVLALPPVERLRDGIRVVLAGPPNAGKSTLLNLMSDREAAIVSPIAGTTRDRVEVPVARDGLPFLLTDTAGLAEATLDPVEAMGVQRARDAVSSADILLWLGDDVPPREDAVWIYPRTDLPGRKHMPLGCSTAIRRDQISTIESVWQFVVERARGLVPGVDQLSMDQRQRALCRVASEQLRQDWRGDVLLAAESVRVAHRQLALLLGQNATEAMLDTLFCRFCVGK